MPYVSCPTCRLASYAVTPHSGHPLCPHCDAELFPASSPMSAVAPPSTDAQEPGASARAA
ncbi:MAG TPA: hypothetical protein VK501_02060 [Baekduia sp.]|uniref:hypothetical protein n=1 Tax=Baekduia sp. TaxID=2600305 RepID=UPI002C6FEB7A|nr:hypothetical protein [Baekduia sp.]HMJ32673.1 hypothetical protein [Baekduia sp.]